MLILAMYSLLVSCLRVSLQGQATRRITAGVSKGQNEQHIQLYVFKWATWVAVATKRTTKNNFTNYSKMIETRLKDSKTWQHMKSIQCHKVLQKKKLN